MSIVRFLGALVSFLVLGLIVQWTINLYERDIEDLPLILALQDEFRIRPEDPAGEEIGFKGLSVNSVIGEREILTEDTSLNLAPLDEKLFENELSPVLVPKEQNDNNMATSITAALESLLEKNTKSENSIDQNIELHIASYSTADKANAHWFLLQQVNSDLLVNYSHQVVKVTESEKDLYRLRVVGFKSIALAQDMCARLIERGEKCVPAVDSR